MGVNTDQPTFGGPLPLAALGEQCAAHFVMEPASMGDSDHTLCHQEDVSKMPHSTRINDSVRTKPPGQVWWEPDAQGRGGERRVHGNIEGQSSAFQAEKDKPRSELPEDSDISKQMSMEVTLTFPDIAENDRVVVMAADDGRSVESEGREVEKTARVAQKDGNQGDAAATAVAAAGRGRNYQRHNKPPHSYITLIAMAIRDSPSGRVTLAQINDYLRARWPFFRGAYTGWRNSVRHNLSLNECFVKVLRDPARPWGKDNYWTINPHSEYVFLDGSFRRRRRRSARRAVAGRDAAVSQGEETRAGKQPIGHQLPFVGIGPIQRAAAAAGRGPPNDRFHIEVHKGHHEVQERAEVCPYELLNHPYRQQVSEQLRRRAGHHHHQQPQQQGPRKVQQNFSSSFTIDNLLGHHCRQALGHEDGNEESRMVTLESSSSSSSTAAAAAAATGAGPLGSREVAGRGGVVYGTFLPLPRYLNPYLLPQSAAYRALAPYWPLLPRLAAAAGPLPPAYRGLPPNVLLTHRSALPPKTAFSQEDCICSGK